MMLPDITQRYYREYVDPKLTTVSGLGDQPFHLENDAQQELGIAKHHLLGVRLDAAPIPSHFL